MTQISWSGGDIAKDKFDASIWVLGQSKNIKTMPKGTFARTEEGVGVFLAWLDAELEKQLGVPAGPFHPCRFVMDSTGRYSVELAIWMIKKRPSLYPAIVNPQVLNKFNASLSFRNKTDDLDARGHCLFGVERQPPAFEPLEGDAAELRELVRERAFLINLRTAAVLRGKELRSCPSVLRIHQKEILHLKKLIAQIEAKMFKLVNRNEQFRADIQFMTSIPGVGRITAGMVLGELGDLRRFSSNRQLSGFSGLSPRRRDSGKKKGKSTISRQSNPILRKGLFMPALATIRGEHDLARTYQRLLDNGKSKKSAICAVMRKTLVLMRTLVIKQEFFDPDFQSSRLQHHAGRVVVACGNS